ncbi:hypothetical protein [Streptomyces sp. NPDC054787]
MPRTDRLPQLAASPLDGPPDQPRVGGEHGCENTGANVTDVLGAVGMDHRLGAHFLRPGIGYPTAGPGRGSRGSDRDRMARAHRSRLDRSAKRTESCAQPVLFDGRNFLDPARLRAIGFRSADLWASGSSPNGR